MCLCTHGGGASSVVRVSSPFVRTSKRLFYFLFFYLGGGGRRVGVLVHALANCTNCLALAAYKLAS